MSDSLALFIILVSVIFTRYLENGVTPNDVPGVGGGTDINSVTEFSKCKSYATNLMKTFREI